MIVAVRRWPPNVHPHHHHPDPDLGRGFGLGSGVMTERRLCNQCWKIKVWPEAFIGLRGNVLLEVGTVMSNSYNKPGVSRAGISRVCNGRGGQVKTKRTSVKVCDQCGNLADRRPSDGSPCPGKLAGSREACGQINPNVARRVA